MSLTGRSGISERISLTARPSGVGSSSATFKFLFQRVCIFTEERKRLLCLGRRHKLDCVAHMDQHIMPDRGAVHQIQLHVLFDAPRSTVAVLFVIDRISPGTARHILNVMLGLLADKSLKALLRLMGDSKPSAHPVKCAYDICLACGIRHADMLRTIYAKC